MELEGDTDKLTGTETTLDLLPEPIFASRAEWRFYFRAEHLEHLKEDEQ